VKFAGLRAAEQDGARVADSAVPYLQEEFVGDGLDVTWANY
jgi:hypothetical protein